MKKFLIPFVILIAATIYFSVFIVKEVNQAIVLQFGDPKRIITTPGLNFKLPFIQNVVFLDKRILYFSWKWKSGEIKIINDYKFKDKKCFGYSKITNITISR